MFFVKKHPKGGTAGAGANYAGAYPAAVSGIATTALEDSLFVRNGTTADDNIGFELAFTGLDPTMTYDLLAYGARGSSGGPNVVYFISDDGGASYTADTGFDSFNNSTAFSNFTGLSGTSSISLVVSGDGSSAAALNFVRLTSTAVPEPSSAGILAISGCAFLLRRRRK